jgi:D-alanine-D-alanine ligase
LRAAGLPTPDWARADNGMKLPKPYIVKAVSEHASWGLDDDAVICTGDEAVCEVIARRSEQLGVPCFAEAYVAGREFNLSLLAARERVTVLAPAEIDFSRFESHRPRIVGYAAKWSEESFDYRHTPRVFVDRQRERLLCEWLEKIAKDCWHLFGLAGYARVDFRVDEAGEPWVLEVNCNPCLAPDAGFAAALEEAHIPWADAVERIIQNAIAPKQS